MTPTPNTAEEYVDIWRLHDLETTISDAAPEELPALHAKLVALSDGLYEALLAWRQSGIDEARIDGRKQAANAINKTAFYSTTNPTGQYVKDCIIKELEDAESDRIAQLKSNKETKQ